MAGKMKVERKEIHTYTERERVNNRTQRHECEVLVLGRLRQEGGQFKVKVGFKVRA